MKIKRLSEKAIIPTRGSEYAAGYDLYAACEEEKITIWPHDTIMIDTGWSMEIPEGYFGAIFARSGLAAKQGLRPANCVGVIDSDYRGEVNVLLLNHTDVDVSLSAGSRIAQIILTKITTPPVVVYDSLDSTSRGESGFGSTGGVKTKQKAISQFFS